MASSRITYPAAVTVGLLFFLTFHIPETGGETIEEESKTVIGSKPPECVNKCWSCRPCKATLVVPTHRKSGFKVSSHHDTNDDDDGGGYYLLSWKCSCGNKLFHP